MQSRVIFKRWASSRIAALKKLPSLLNSIVLCFCLKLNDWNNTLGASEVIGALFSVLGLRSTLCSLVDLLISLKQCFPNAAVSSSVSCALAVPHLCTVQGTCVVYLARLQPTLRCQLACIGCCVMKGGFYSLFTALWTLSKHIQLKQTVIVHVCGVL